MRFSISSLVAFAVWAGCGFPDCHSDARTNVTAKSTPTRARLSARDFVQEWPCYTLRAEHTWYLNHPEGKPFEASGLLWTMDGDLLAVDDSGPTLYRIQLREGWFSSDLIPISGLFALEQLKSLEERKVGGYDCEGIAQDGRGRLYICEEANRWILRTDPKTGTLECLNIDWTPVQKYFHPTDRNASFEGIAIGGDRLYVANERKRGRIIVVDLETMRVVDEFLARPHGCNARDVHYSDLCWFEDSLFVLLRESRCVLKVDPRQRRVQAQYNFGQMESAPGKVYYTHYPTGTMEGLAVDRDFIWLVTDNNGFGLISAPTDVRPTLFKCRRPDRSPENDSQTAEGRDTASNQKANHGWTQRSRAAAQ